jgi:serine/threonine protein kinase/Tfp pilus assembly protein PilF
MTALLANPSDAVSDLYATAMLDGPVPLAPMPAADHSGLIDQAYSEYRHLRDAGVQVDPDAFCARFPNYQTSLRRLLEVHREIEANPNLLRSLDNWPTSGDTFHGFQLEEELGRGAFARVFLARESAVGNRKVVVKVSLHADDEAGTLGKLQHPNVVPIHSARFDETTGFAVVCMPFLGGTTLLPIIEALSSRKTPPAHASVLLDAAKDDRWSADSGASPARALRRGTFLDGVLYLGERLASALAYVHERGILHRDMKPSNVVICPNGEPVLIDFNLAYDRSMSEHRLGGTLPYMPPEQLAAMATRRSGDVILPDHRGDIYALGVILYELVTGRHPFGPVPLKLKTADARDFLISKQREGPKPLRGRNRTIDPALDRLIARCLSADPNDRPATARELAKEFAKLQATRHRALRWVTSHVKTVAAAVVLFVTGAATAGVQIANLPSPAVVHAENGNKLYHDGAYDKAIDEFSASLAAKPDQPDMWFARGRAYQKLGDFKHAAKDIAKANPDSDGRAAASLAYCRSWSYAHADAVKWYRKAIELGHGGVNQAAVHNNIALSLCRQGKLNDFLAAEDEATEAIRKEPALRAAYYNRAWARYYLLYTFENGNSAAEGLADARMAISLGGGGTTTLYYTAAALCAAEVNAAGNPDEHPLDGEGLEYVKKAVAHGYPVVKLALSDARLPRLAIWTARLKPEDVATQKSTGMDEDIRLDPIVD